MKTPYPLLLLAPLFALAGCAIISGGETPQAIEPAAAKAPTLDKIADNVWLHKSWRDIPGYGPILSQGLVVQTRAGVLLVDTAWTDEDTLDLINLIEAETGAAPIAGIATHAHADKMGGMAAANERMNTAAFALSNEDAPGRNLTPALNSIDEASINGPLTLQLKDQNGRVVASGGVEIFYPGPGHTRDNIVVYYAPAKILFGGCLIRPRKARDLGNTADGDVAHWADAVSAVAARFPDAEIVVPSHGPAGGRKLLDHTIKLAEDAATADG